MMNSLLGETVNILCHFLTCQKSFSLEKIKMGSGISVKANKEVKHLVTQDMIQEFESLKSQKKTTEEINIHMSSKYGAHFDHLEENEKTIDNFVDYNLEAAM